jgi:hypothetical protein
MTSDSPEYSQNQVLIIGFVRFLHGTEYDIIVLVVRKQSDTQYSRFGLRRYNGLLRRYGTSVKRRRKNDMALNRPIILLVTSMLIATAYAADSRSANPEWRAYINNSCIVADEPFLLPESDDDSDDRFPLFLGAIATKLAGALINVAVDGAVGGLRAGGARKDSTYVIAEDFNLYSVDLSESPAAHVTPRMGCFTIVAGTFAGKSVDCTGEYIPRDVAPDMLQQPQSTWTTSRTDNSIENILRRANVCLLGETKSVHEARIIFSEDKTAYRMQGAGYWINSLSSTKSTRAKRDMLYTLEIVEPAAGNVDKVLSTAWISVGKVSAGSTAPDYAAADSSDWLRVPPMSYSARRAHQSDTATHKDVLGHIEALERSVVRDARLLDGIRTRAKTAPPEVRAALDKEMARIRVRIVTSESMLDARHSEYGDLPLSDLSYMPVTMRFGITESRSEKKAMQALAAVLESNKEYVTQTADEMIGIDRSFELASDEDDLDSLRRTYFDALVAVTTESAETSDELKRELDIARLSFNTARVADGLTPIQ